MKVQTPYGVKEIKIIKSPHVINYQRRAGIIAAKWLAMSPYAKYQELLDQAQREYLAKIKELQLNFQRQLSQMRFQTYNEFLAWKRDMLNQLEQANKERAQQAAEMLFYKLIENGVPEIEAREVVLQYLMNVKPLAKFSNDEINAIASQLYENYMKNKKPEKTQVSQVTQPQQTTVSLSSGRSSRRHRTSKREVGHSKSESSYFPTTPSIVEIRGTSGRVIGYHDNIRKMSYMVPPSTKSQKEERKVSEKPAELKKVEKQLQQAISEAEKEAKQTAEVIGKAIASHPVVQLAIAVNNFANSVVNTIKSIFGWR